MRVWDSVGQGAIHFDAADVGEPHLGHIVENRVVQRALWARLGALTNVELRCPASVVHFDVSDDFVTVELAAGHSIKGRLLVAADGVHSPIRQLAGISAVGWSYAQHAVVANVHTEMPHHETAWQRFLPSGPLAFLPLADGRCSVVWSTTPDHAAELLRLNDEQFCVALTDGFGARLGRVLGTGPRAAYPLRLQHATQYVLPRIALVGDAAHAIHPLAGQGANLGFLDVAWLAAILETVNDPGGIAALRRYERARKGDNLRMMAAMDGFKRVFGTASGPLVWLRRLGLGVADNSRILKQGLVRHAMGVNGDLPQLARSPLV
jgi:2-octaprenylphenol hydroxylase